MTPFLIITIAVLLLWAGIFLVYRHEVARAFVEPALRFPLLIFESDDWGPGPRSDADVLLRIARLLEEFTDRNGRHPVMTLGIALAAPDTIAIRSAGGRKYQRVTLRDLSAAEVRASMLAGRESGAFSLQLHGMEHFWPATVLEAARDSKEIAAWLTGPPLPRTEVLPASLQSRWVNASSLPSREHSADEVRALALAEVGEFAQTFDIRPAVVVPPTFLWTDAVERAWAAAGVEVLVCPGRQFVGRDANGQLIPGRGPILNGQQGASGITYVVRDVFFEPERGHRAADAMASLRIKTEEARPTLLEIHRSNFIGADAARERSIAEIRALLHSAKEEFPNLCFADTAELARAMATRNPEWVCTGPLVRAAVCLKRLRSVPRLGRLMRWSGLALVSAMLKRLAMQSRELRRGAVASAAPTDGH